MVVVNEPAVAMETRGLAGPEMFQLQPSVVIGGAIMATRVLVIKVPSPIHNRNARLPKRPKNPPCK